MLRKSDPITDPNTKCPFKQYAGLTIGQVIQEDAQFLVWAHYTVDWFELDYALLDLAENNGREPVVGDTEYARRWLEQR